MTLTETKIPEVGDKIKILKLSEWDQNTFKMLRGHKGEITHKFRDDKDRVFYYIFMDDSLRNFRIDTSTAFCLREPILEIIEKKETEKCETEESSSEQESVHISTD